jgi:hypothetical protein
MVLFAVLARFALRIDDLMTWGGGSVPYIAAALLGASAMYDVLALWGQRSVAMTLSVIGDELIVRQRRRPTPIARAPLHSVRVAKATWERQLADMPEFNWKRLPSLQVTVDATCELTVGVGVEPWDRRLLPTPAHPSAPWPAHVPRARPPKYLALAEDWTALVEALTSASGSPEHVRQETKEGVGRRRDD